MNNYSAILCLTNLGDGVLLSPCLSALSENLSETRWALVAKPSICELYNHDKRIDKLIPFTCSWFPGTNGNHDGLKGVLKTAKTLRSLKCRTALNTVSDIRTNLLAHLGGIKKVISSYGRHKNWLSTEIVAYELEQQHEAERQLELASALIGRELEPHHLKIELSLEDKNHALSLLEGFGNFQEPLVAVHPGANVDFKAWPLQRFAEVCRFLTESRKCRIAVLGASGQEEELADEFIERIGSNAVNLAGKTPVRVLLALLRFSHLFVGNDSGPMHMAAAAGCPTVAIFGATNPYRFSPYLPESLKKVIISSDFSLDVVGAGREKGREMLDKISVDRVIKAIDEIWEKVEARHKTPKMIVGI